VLIALLSDIHGNRQAFESCLAAAAAARADRIVVLGDIVGYGADPEWCVATTMALAQDGAIVIRGNHDEAAAHGATAMTSTARFVIEWTRNRLAETARQFLGDLPLTVKDEDRLYVHAGANRPAEWHYVLDNDGAQRHFSACQATVSFCGHTHRPMLYSSAGGKLTRFVPNAPEPIPLPSHRRWLAVMGAVGQPRDGNPSAAMGLYDTATRGLRFLRIAYDIDAAVARIRTEGLPEALANRLTGGK